MRVNPQRPSLREPNPPSARRRQAEAEEGEVVCAYPSKKGERISFRCLDYWASVRSSRAHFMGKMHRALGHTNLRVFLSSLTAAGTFDWCPCSYRTVYYRRKSLVCDQLVIKLWRRPCLNGLLQCWWRNRHRCGRFWTRNYRRNRLVSRLSEWRAPYVKFWVWTARSGNAFEAFVSLRFFFQVCPPLFLLPRRCRFLLRRCGGFTVSPRRRVKKIRGDRQKVSVLRTACVRPLFFFGA